MSEQTVKFGMEFEVASSPPPEPVITLKPGEAIKCLSIRQPWAWLIVNGHKDVENRTWGTSYRGLVAVHAAKTFDADSLNRLIYCCPDIDFPPIDDFDLGGIVGTVRLTRCVNAWNSRWFEGPRGFVMEDAKPLPLIPMRGQLGLFDWPGVEP